MLASKEMTDRLPDSAPQYERQTGETRGIERILIVDDSPSIASIIEQMLEIAGFQTQVAYDAQGGYGEYLDFKPDLIITDVYMTGQSGPELIKQIRKDEPRIRTIYMSGYPDINCECLYGEKGRYPNCYFLQKPFSRADLLRVIAQFVSQNQ
jgi:two-component system, cell cycle sensor histidine kinase and response regulator CckA